QAAFASVNFGLNEKPRAEKKAFDFSRSRTARLTKILRARVSAMSDSILDFALSPLPVSVPGQTSPAHACASLRARRPPCAWRPTRDARRDLRAGRNGRRRTDP